VEAAAAASSKAPLGAGPPKSLLEASLSPVLQMVMQQTQQQLLQWMRLLLLLLIGRPHGTI
jgi:hypothetical protein